MKLKIALIDDEPSIFYGIDEILCDYEIEVFNDPLAALSRIDKYFFDLYIVDYRMPGLNGLEFLIEVKKRQTNHKALLLTAYAEKDILAKAINNHLVDKIIEKPFDINVLKHTIEEIAAQKDTDMDKLRAELLRLKQENVLITNIVGLEGGLWEVYKKIRTIAPLNVPVLLTGETGTGKEVIVDLIHQLSPRKYKPVVKINCATLQDSLFESELFGHEKGAFTGADTLKKGKIELANQGILFLDEIAEMKPELQAKFLRVLEEKKFTRVGGTAILQVDFRLIAATNADLEEMVQTKRFRADLFYRLNRCPVLLPPLRQRKQDIILLADFLIQKAGEEADLSQKQFSEEAQIMLKNYKWGGNIRELENVVFQALLLAQDQEEITSGVLEQVLIRDNREYMTALEVIAMDVIDKKIEFDNIEQDIIMTILKQFNHKVSLVTEKTSLSRQKIYRVLKGSKDGVKDS